ncbi:MAG: VOC family protein [Caulobacteraceae bacterium]|nr:VOC family protein [Caulobacteraceae bacterium]
MSTVLFRNHFQIAYVARDAEAAMAWFRDRYGVAKWHVMDMSGQGSGARFICLAYAGEVMLEIIEPAPGVPSIYESWLAPDQLLRHHHHGFWAHSAEELRQIRERFEANGVAIPSAARFGDVLEFLYADTVAELGHYYEVIHMLPGGKDFFTPVPRNG